MKVPTELTPLHSSLNIQLPAQQVAADSQNDAARRPNQKSGYQLLVAAFAVTAACGLYAGNSKVATEVPVLGGDGPMWVVPEQYKSEMLLEMPMIGLVEPFTVYANVVGV